MNKMVIKCISWLSLAALILIVVMYLLGSTQLDTVKRWLLILTAVWFISASMWMWDEDK